MVPAYRGLGLPRGHRGPAVLPDAAGGGGRWGLLPSSGSLPELPPLGNGAGRPLSGCSSLPVGPTPTISRVAASRRKFRTAAGSRCCFSSCLTLWRMRVLVLGGQGAPYRGRWPFPHSEGLPFPSGIRSPALPELSSAPEVIAEHTPGPDSGAGDTATVSSPPCPPVVGLALEEAARKLSGNALAHCKSRSQCPLLDHTPAEAPLGGVTQLRGSQGEASRAAAGRREQGVRSHCSLRAALNSSIPSPCFSINCIPSNPSQLPPCQPPGAWGSCCHSPTKLIMEKDLEPRAAAL